MSTYSAHINRGRRRIQLRASTEAVAKIVDDPTWTALALCAAIRRVSPVYTGYNMETPRIVLATILVGLRERARATITETSSC